MGYSWECLLKVACMRLWMRMSDRRAMILHIWDITALSVSYLPESFERYLTVLTHTHAHRGKEEEREYRLEALEKKKTWLRKASRDLSYLTLSLHLSLSFIPNPKLALFQSLHHLSVVSTRLPTSYVFSLTRSSKWTSSLSTTFFTRWYLFCNSEMSVCLVFNLQGKPAPAAKRVAPLCQVGQADSSSVSGPTRAATSGRQCQLASRLLRDHAGDEWARQEKDPWQVAALH